MSDMLQRVRDLLPDNYPWADLFQYVPEVGSTNDVLKALAKQGAPHGTALLAGAQTAGRGRLGRSFQSPPQSGVYLSMLLRPNCAPGQLMHLTCATAVAMCQAVEDTVGLRPGVKWTNDLVWQRRKLGGILTELGLTPSGQVDYAIVGIGINCATANFPPELQNMVTSLQQITGSQIPRENLTAAMLINLAKMAQELLPQQAQMLEQYRRDCITIGQEISVVQGDFIRHGQAIDVDDQGALVVRFPDGSVQAVNSGEVSVRGMYGYV